MFCVRFVIRWMQAADMHRSRPLRRRNVPVGPWDSNCRSTRDRCGIGLPHWKSNVTVKVVRAHPYVCFMVAIGNRWYAFGGLNELKRGGVGRVLCDENISESKLIVVNDFGCSGNCQPHSGFCKETLVRNSTADELRRTTLQIQFFISARGFFC